MKFRVGTGYDSHRLEENRPLVIGGIHIPYHKGLAAHSDGDVLIHAMIDALLGALALKDIGTHFPDHDLQYKNIDSKILLSQVVNLLLEEGWTINNIDCTLVIEKPKIAPFIDTMTGILSPLLHISPADLSIKAKSNEKMGFTGREEGIAAHVIVAIVKNG